MRPCICCSEEVELVADGLCKLCYTYISSDLDIEYPDDE